MTIPGSSPFSNPPNNQPSLVRVSRNRAPGATDNKNFRKGDEWLDTSSNDWYKLANISGETALWVKIGGTATSVEEFLVSSGVSPVGPNDDNEITLQDGNGISWTGGVNSLQANSTLSYAADSGSAAAVASTISVTGGTNITTSAAGATVTISADIIDLPWSVETGTSRTMSVDTGNIGNNAAGVTFTLPDTAAVGNRVRVTGLQASWQIAQNAGDTIHFGNQSTTTGVTGSLASTLSRDAVELVCVVENTDWQVISSVGNITVA